MFIAMIQNTYKVFKYQWTYWRVPSYSSHVKYSLMKLIIC